MFIMLLAYNDLEQRKLEREKMWQNPGWDDCVAATGKLWFWTHLGIISKF